VASERSSSSHLGGPPHKKPIAHSVQQLDHLSRQIGAPVDDTTVDRILASIDLASTHAEIDAAKLDARRATEIKRLRWGGQVRSMLSLVTALVRRRKLGTSQAPKKLAGAAKALSHANRMLKEDPAIEAALTIAKMMIVRVREDLEHAKTWTRERIAGEYLPTEYYGIFGRRPKMTRPRLAPGKSELEVPETIRFIQAVLDELDISYSRESIIAAMQASKKKKRRR
jgi:hypothetical protein